MDESQKRGIGWVFWAAVAITLPVLYVASVGPVAWLVNQEIIPETLMVLVEAFYLPLASAMELCKPFGEAIEGYIEICGG